MTTAPGDIISKLRDVEEYAITNALPECEREFVVEDFIALTGALELLVRDFVADYFAQRASLLAKAEDLVEASAEIERLSENRTRLAIANTELALVVTTAIQWRSGAVSDDELRTVVDALLAEPAVLETAHVLKHEEPSA